MSDAVQHLPHNDDGGRGPAPHEGFLHLRRRISAPRRWSSAQDHQSDADDRALGQPARWTPPDEGAIA